MRQSLTRIKTTKQNPIMTLNIIQLQLTSHSLSLFRTKAKLKAINARKKERWWMKIKVTAVGIRMLHRYNRRRPALFWSSLLDWKTFCKVSWMFRLLQDMVSHFLYRHFLWLTLFSLNNYSPMGRGSDTRGGKVLQPAGTLLHPVRLVVHNIGNKSGKS